jgi:predicted protein tyrosine phosphatase
LKVLFVCSRNRRRSLTAERMFADTPGCEVRSAGTEPGARVRVTAGHLGWADLVVAMEKRHVGRLREKYADVLAGKRVVCLHIPDEYECMDRALVERLEAEMAVYLEPMESETMQFQLTHALEVLERTPATFRALLGGMSTAWTAPNEGPDTFSAFDNVGHLIHGERTDWIPRARLILAQEANRRFEPYDRFAQYHESQGKSLAELLDEFARLRAENLVTLRGWQLSERELALEGEHPELGVVTLRQLLATWVAHDLGHVAQTARVLAKQYREAVGPWRVYLPVLDR